MLDFLSTLFLESPIQLGILSFLIFAAALFLRLRVREQIMPYVLPGSILLIALLFLIQYLVATPREKIVATLHDFVKAVESKNAPAIAAPISQTFDAAGLTKPELLDIINSKLARIRIYDTRLSPAVRVDGETATMLLGAGATVSVDGGVGEFHMGTWRFTWTRVGDAWQISDLRPVRLDTIEISGWSQLQSLVP